MTNLLHELEAMKRDAAKQLAVQAIEITNLAKDLELLEAKYGPILATVGKSQDLAFESGHVLGTVSQARSRAFVLASYLDNECNKLLKEVYP